jgi:hypothetical protein
LLWALLLAGICTASASEAPIPTQPAYLDLRKWNFARGDATFLLGHWEFFWMELLSPEDVKKRIPIQYFPMPATWHKQLKICCGYATYHLRVDVGDAKDMALEIPHMSTAVKIFVNGAEFFKAGNVGTTEETSIPSRNSGILRLPDAGRYDIVVQISNFQMPTGKSTACVLAFDIIGSSRIEHIHVKSFLENSIKRCLSIIDEGYDPEQLTATGYRIKEMGDGFLCSVGFPFRTPGMGNFANSSVQLALRFVQIFHEEARLFAYAEPIHCSIGIAYDTIEGYFRFL